MKKQNFSKIKGILGILLLALTCAGIFYWEFYGREQLTYSTVLVAAEKIEKNEIITKEKVKFVKREEKTLVIGCLKENDSFEILGLEAKHDIPEGTQIVQEYFEAPELVINEEEFIFKIPSDWLISYPTTLRRKDKIYIYPVLESDINGEGRKTITEDPIESIVAYVKDATNKEVLGDQDRINSTAGISSIEIISTLEMVDKLKNYTNNEYSFVILYNY